MVNDWHFFEKKGYGAVFSRLKAATSFLGGQALYGDKGLRMMIERTEDVSNIIRSPVSMEIVVWSHESERSRVICAKDFKDTSVGRKNLLKFIKASASFPGLFPPEKINNEIYSDGYSCILNSFFECDTVFFIDSGQPRQLAETAKPRWNLYLMKAIVGLIDRRVEDEIVHFVKKNKFKIFPSDPDAYSTITWKNILKRTKKVRPKPNKRFIFIAPTLHIPSLQIDKFNNKNGDISKIIDHGYERPKEILSILSTSPPSQY